MMKKKRQRGKPEQKAQQKKVPSERQPPQQANAPPGKHQARHGLHPKPGRPQLKGRRLWLLRFLLIFIIPAATLFSVEVGLRVVGYGVPTGFTFTQKVGNQKLILSNPYFTWRFFEPQLARQGSYFSLPQPKQREAYRIFILGGSAAHGTPEPAYGMTRMLDAMLQDQYPGVVFDVMNAAITAINTHVVLPIAKDCSMLESDLFIIYLGNNEVVGPYGAGTVFSPLVSNLCVIRGAIALKATRLGRLMSDIATKMRNRAQTQPGQWGGMRMFLNNQVRATDSDLETVYRHFERNLLDICRLAQESGIPAIVSTVGVNLKDNPPFASLHHPGLSNHDLQAWEEISREGEALLARGEFELAVERFLQAERIDASHAELHFLLGKCYWEMGDFAKAKVRYVKARELDTLRFRADTRINETIRRVSGGKTKQGLHLVDSLKTIEANSPHNTPGNELFYEHVHLNFRGTYVVTRAIFEQVRRVLPAWVSRHASGRPVLTERECAQRLAYTGWDRFTIAKGLLNQMQTPPFSNQLWADEKVEMLSAEVETLKIQFTREEEKQAALAQYKAAIERGGAHWRLHDAYAKFQYNCLGNPREAEKHWQAAIEQSPQSALSHTHLAEAVSAQGKHAEAVQHYRIALTYLPQSSSAMSNLGAELLRENDPGLAIRYLNDAIKIDPQNAMAHSNLGVALGYRSADPSTRRQAVWHIKKAVDIKPDLLPARRNLAAVYAREATDLLRHGEKKRARELLQEAVELAPTAMPLYNLATLLNEAEDEKGAVEHLSEVLRIDPKHLKARKALGQIYTRQGVAFAQEGNPQQARVKLQQTVDLLPDEASAHYNLAKVLNVLDDHSESLNHLKEALRIDPYHEKAREMAQRDLPSLTLPVADGD